MLVDNRPPTRPTSPTAHSGRRSGRWVTGAHGARGGRRLAQYGEFENGAGMRVETLAHIQEVLERKGTIFMQAALAREWDLNQLARRLGEIE
jgi:hypothetical protein